MEKLFDSCQKIIFFTAFDLKDNERMIISSLQSFFRLLDSLYVNT